jgi:hypothetical protein
MRLPQARNAIRCSLATALLALSAISPTLIRPARAADEAVPLNVEIVVDQGIKWLAGRQIANGAFGTTGHTAVTSLAVLAFLARGHVPGQGPYGEAINRAIDYVLIAQRPNGILSPEATGQPMYDHGISTIMLCECYGMVDEARQPKIRAAIAKAARVILEAQRIPKEGSSAGGWRYTPTSGDSDISVTGWQLMALRAAANNGAAVPKSALDAGVAYIKKRATASGGFSYTNGTDATTARTGTGVLALALLGQLDSREAQAGGEYLLRTPVRPETDQFFYYAVYYCSQAANQLGGKYWAGVYLPIRETLLHTQQQNGSWLTLGAEGQGGDVYSTSMALLALAIPYRSLPMYQR